ncbi:HutD family protein [Rhodococcus sp. NPDC003348]
MVHDTDRRRAPWRNGAGATEEVAIGPDSVGGQPIWRISLADLGDAPSKFSAFPGVDRIFTVVGAHGVTLDRGRHGPEPLTPWRPHAFAGEDAPRCVPAGNTRAFNVMTERGAATATVEPVRVDGPLRTHADEVTALFVRAGAVHAGPERAAPGDCIVVRNEAIDLFGAADGLVVRIRTTG